MKHILSFLLVTLVTLSCTVQDNNKNIIINYNLIEPIEGIYAIKEENVLKENLEGTPYEAVYLVEKKLIRIERYDTKGQLTDEWSVAAVTVFDYDSNGNVSMTKYFDRFGKRSEDEIFHYWSVEYIYDEMNRVKMEIYRDKDSKFLRIPKDEDGNILSANFLSPILVYEYQGDQIKIKAFDDNFNLLKETLGAKPCVPFIDCGENEL